MPRKPKETKVCLTCNLPFANRKRWASRGQWAAVQYCSDRCRKKKV